MYHDVPASRLDRRLTALLAAADDAAAAAVADAGEGVGDDVHRRRGSTDAAV